MAKQTSKKLRKVQQSATANNTRTRRKIRASLSDLPVDILLEILSSGCLWPLDLLHLSRTSKHFWGLLTQNTNVNKLLWKQAYKNLAAYTFPPSRSRYIMSLSPPDEITDDRYIYWTHLLFFDFCQICLAEGKDVRMRTLLEARVCMACLDQKYCDLSPHPSYNVLSQSGLLREEAIKPETVVISSRIFRHKRWSGSTDTITMKVPKIEVEAAVQAFERLKADPTKWAEYISRKKREVQRKETVCDTYFQWKYFIDRVHEAEHDKACDRRTADILTRLGELGWQEELELISATELMALKRNKRIRQARPLNKDIWKRLQPRVTAMMEDIRARRLASVCKTSPP